MDWQKRLRLRQCELAKTLLWPGLWETYIFPSRHLHSYLPLLKTLKAERDMAYQSFPWEDGDSRSLEKLAALELSKLKGKTVLDIGCNTGFFCGFAAWQGAEKVVGVDSNPAFVETAREIFSACEFRCQNWMDLPDEQYDVILFLSAIHYAPDQQAMLDFLMKRLKPNGTLVLELGIAPGDTSTFVPVRRSIDTRFFPTAKKLEEMLAPYTMKWIGKSIPQAGDPIPRFVVHVRPRRPAAILLMDVPRSGKSTTARELFNASIPRISGDVIYYEIMLGKRQAPREIMEIIRETGDGEELDCSSVSIQICNAGHIGKLCALIGEIAAGQSFILDMFIPHACRRSMIRWWDEHGYFVLNAVLEDARVRPYYKEAGSFKYCLEYLHHLEHNFLINEEEYLAANPDVARAVATGRMPSAQFHYWHFGRKEKRKLKPE